MKFLYSIVRFVPDTFRGEFVNVAVIAGSESTGEWMVRRVDNVQHARRLGGNVPITPVWNYLDNIESLIDQSTENQLAVDPNEMNRNWLLREHRRLRNLVQITPPTAVVADSIEDAISMMFDAFVVDPEKRSRKTRGQRAPGPALTRLVVPNPRHGRNCSANQGMVMDDARPS